MIVITGAAGFIGSSLCRKLNAHGIKNVVLVDDFSPEKKRKNWENLEYVDKIHRELFFRWAEQNVQHIDFIFHLGSRTDNFSTDEAILEALNTDFSQRIWSFSTLKHIPLVYASSYLTNATESLSLFAKSKFIFDKWIEKQQHTPPFWAGLKFFQVYGNNEAHKEKNASNVYKICQKYREKSPTVYIKKNVTLDYLYINDATKVLFYFLNHAPKSGIYEVGTGFARPLQAIVDAVNKEGLKVRGIEGLNERGREGLKLEIHEDSPNYPHILPPQSLNPSTLQSFNPSIFQADLTNLRKYAYKQSFLTLEKGVKRMMIEK